MPYATVDDVQRRMPQFVLSPITKPNLETAQVFLDDTHAAFDASLENLGYVVPITGPRALAQCKEIVCQGAIAKILYARASAVGTDVAIQSADRAQKQYDHALETLADAGHPAELTDARRTDDELMKPGVEPMGLTHDEVTGDPIEPRFTMDSRF